MIGCGNAMREPLPVVLDRLKRELSDGSGQLCVCMERRGRVVLTSASNAIPSELLVTVRRGCADGMRVAAEAVAHELASRSLSCVK